MSDAFKFIAFARRHVYNDALSEEERANLLLNHPFARGAADWRTDVENAPRDGTEFDAWLVWTVDEAARGYREIHCSYRLRRDPATDTNRLVLCDQCGNEIALRDYRAAAWMLIPTPPELPHPPKSEEG